MANGDLALFLGSALSGFTKGLGGGLLQKKEMEASAQEKKEQRAHELELLGIKELSETQRSILKEKTGREEKLFEIEAKSLSDRLVAEQKALSSALGQGAKEESTAIKAGRANIKNLSDQFQTLLQTQKEGGSLKTIVPPPRSYTLQEVARFYQSARSLQELEELGSLNVEGLTDEDILTIQLLKNNRKEELLTKRGEIFSEEQQVGAPKQGKSSLTQQIEEISQQTGITDPKTLKEIFKAKFDQDFETFINKGQTLK